MPVHRVYVKFSGPREAWQVFDFATERGRGRFIAAHRRSFAAWVIEDGCTGAVAEGTAPPPHLPVLTNEERARQHGALGYGTRRTRSDGAGTGAGLEGAQDREGETAPKE